jgi:S1-C subfamily serine protease
MFAITRRKAVMKMTSKIRIWTSVAALSGAMLVGGVVIAETSRAGAKLAAPIFAPEPKNMAMAAPPAMTYSPLIKEALPEVVNIASSRTVHHSDEESNPMFDDPFFRQFFGDRQPHAQRQQPQQRQEKEQGLGSGVIVATNGYILTNNHVVDMRQTLRSRLGTSGNLPPPLSGEIPRRTLRS